MVLDKVREETYHRRMKNAIGHLVRELQECHMDRIMQQTLPDAELLCPFSAQFLPPLYPEYSCTGGLSVQLFLLLYNLTFKMVDLFKITGLKYTDISNWSTSEHIWPCVSLLLN